MAAKTYEGEPNYAVHPGEMLAEYIEVYHCEKEELAARLGITPKHLSNIVNCKAGITANTARALEMVFPDKSAESWLNGQQRFDLFCLREEGRSGKGDLFGTSNWLSRFDYDSLSNRGYVPAAERDTNPREKALNLLSFFGCANVHAWEAVYGKVLRAAESQVPSAAGKPGNALAWLRQGERQASLWFNRLPRLDRRAFARSLKRIGKGVASSAGSDAARSESFFRAKERCAESGVMLISEPAPENQPVQSALFWSRQAPCIQVNSSLETDDEFWFGFAREAERLMEADDKEAVIDMQGNVLEWLAVDDSYGWLMSVDARCEFLQQGDLSKQAIVQFAENVDVAPGVVVGWLQAQGELSQDSPLNALKSRVEYAVLSLEDWDPEYYR